MGTRQQKSKCQHKRKRPRKRRRRTLSQKRKRKLRSKTTKEDSDFEVIPEVSEKTNIYPTLPSEEQTRLWKTNPRQPENKDGKETTEKMDSNTHTSAEDMKGNEKEDKVEAALKTMQAWGSRTMVDGFPASLELRVEMSARSWTPSSLARTDFSCHVLLVQ